MRIQFVRHEKRQHLISLHPVSPNFPSTTVSPHSPQSPQRHSSMTPKRQNSPKDSKPTSTHFHIYPFSQDPICPMAERCRIMHIFVGDFPINWALRIGVHPSVHDEPLDNAALCRSDLIAEECSQSTVKPYPSPHNEGLYSPADGKLCPCSFL